MKAIVLTRYGPPSEVLRLEEVPRPEPGEGEVLVKVFASALNDWDWTYATGTPWALRLLYGLFEPKVRILGAELAGRVEAVGPGVTRLRPGDEVYGDVSGAGFGGFAEYAAVREGALARKPASMTFHEAAALPHASMLAHQGLVAKGRLREGETVLINGAGGGVGSVAVQIAKLHGAETTGVDNGAKQEFMRSMGFDHVIDYEKVDFTKSGKRYDLILDTKTTRGPLDYLRSLEAGGSYVTVGGHLTRLLQLSLAAPIISRFSAKRLKIVALQPNKDLAYVGELFEAGKLRCAIDGPIVLEQVPDGVQYFGDARHRGKVVINVAGETP